MKKALHDIREFFWPLLEYGPDDEPPAEKKELEIVVADENLEEAYKLQWKIVDAEEDRRKSVESKASLFIGTISVAASLVVAANVLITNTQVITVPISISLIFSCVLGIYAVRTVWFSVKTLQRGAYQVLSIKDVNVAGTTTDYRKHLIKVCLNIVDKNKDTINDKVNQMVMAQEYFKRAIGTLSVYFLFVLISSFFPKTPVAKKEPTQIDKIEILNRYIYQQVTPKTDSGKDLKNSPPAVNDSMPLN